MNPLIYRKEVDLLNKRSCVNCFHLRVRPFQVAPNVRKDLAILKFEQQLPVWCRLGKWTELKKRYPKDVRLKNTDKTSWRALRERPYLFEKIAELCEYYDGEDT